MGSQSEAGPAADEKYYPIAPEQWKDAVLDLRNFNVIKFPRVLQSVCYLLGYSREDICERDTNKLSFKKVREIIGDESYYQKMAEYKFAGPKTQEFRSYEKMTFLKKNLELEEEQLEQYSQTVFKLYQWATMSIELRCEDVITRRDNIEELKNAREMAINQANERKEKLDAALNDAKAAFDTKIQDDQAKKALDEGDDGEEDEEADLPQFPLEEFMAEFSATHPEIEIPDPVKDDIDNDYDLPYQAPSFE